MKFKHLKTTLLALATTVSALSVSTIALTSCGGTTDNTVYSITYSSAPDGLTFTSKPTSVNKGESVTINYTISSGYVIDKTNSVVSSGSNTITSKCTFSSTTLTIPADSITGNLTISLKTKDASTATFSVTYGSDTKITWILKPTTVAYSNMLTAKFSVATGYAVDETSSDILIDGTSIKGQTNVLYNNGVVSIPAEYITGDVTINIVSRSSQITYHTVTLNANGGTFSDGSTTKTISNVYTLTKNLLPDPIHSSSGSTSYSFYGWYTDSSCTTPVTYGITLSTNVTYYAKWVTETVAPAAYTKSGDNIVVDESETTVTCTVNESTNNADNTLTLSGNWSNKHFVFIPGYEKAKINVVLNNCVIYSDSSYSPMLFTTNGDNEFKTVTITASGDLNCIYDGRASASTSVTDTSSGAITLDAGDLVLDGTGVLKINDQSKYPGYEESIEVDGKLTIQNLTLYCYAYDTVMRGKKAVTLNSGNITCYSMIGDGIKTKNTKLKDGVRNGTITITGSTKLELSVAGDAIDAAYDVVICSDGTNSPEVSIATGTKSNYTNSTKAKAAIDKQDMYLRTTESYTESNYYYTVGFSNDKTLDPTTYEFEEEETLNVKKIVASGQQPGPKSENAQTYVYYNCDRPYGYKYAYLIKRNITIDPDDGNVVAASSAFQIPESSVTQDTSEKNCATFTVSGTSLSVNSYSNWGNYKDLIGSSVVEKSGQTTWGSKGIKADNAITISDGKVVIDGCDDAIKAKGTVVLGTGDNAGWSTGNVTISGGEVNIACVDDGIHSDNTLTISGGNVTITQSYEGIEGGIINISGGNTSVYCTDDAMNAAEVGKIITSNIQINVSGGTLDLTAYGQDVDGIDSNNGYTQTGGLVISRGTSGTAFDLADSVTGSVSSTGILICLGRVESSISSSYTYQLTSGTCSQGSHTITGLTSSTISFYNMYSFGSGVRVYTGTAATGTPKLN